METTAWKNLQYTYPPHIPTMLSEEETLYLYWLGCSVWDGGGLIVEIGPWLGGSTVCLAAGMNDSAHNAQKQLKVFDNFIWREFMAARAPLPLKPGESFQPAFEENLSQYSHIVDAYARALPDETIENDSEAQKKRFHETGHIPIFEDLFPDPVSLLFIDGAKSWQGMLHLFRTLNSKFIPGSTLLVCQDYKYWGTYWVPVMMSRLAKYIEPVHNVLPGTTVTFRLTREIPSSQLEECPGTVSRLDTSHTLALIDHASGLLAKDGDGPGSGGVLLGKVSFLSHQGLTQQAAQAFKEIQGQWKKSWPDWQLERARAYLNEEKNMIIAPPLSQSLSKVFKKAARKAGRLIKRS